jgi:hypothetical protein
MKKFTLSIIAFIVLGSTLLAQQFEGKIIYDTKYKSKSFLVSDAKLNDMMGNLQEYYFKDGNYKSVVNGSMMEWQMYVQKENKLYTKAGGGNTIYWSDASKNPDEVISFEINKNVTRILGYKCDELILKCKSGTQKYYFSSDLKVDEKLFEKHLFGNWSEYIKHSKSLPLKVIVETGQFTLVQLATEVKPQKISSDIFEIPADAKLTKSPF